MLTGHGADPAWIDAQGPQFLGAPVESHGALVGIPDEVAREWHSKVGARAAVLEEDRASGLPAAACEAVVVLTLAVEESQEFLVAGGANLEHGQH